MRMASVNEKGVNVGSLAKQFRREGYIPQADPAVQAFTPNSEEALLAYGALKPEFYALAAVVSDRIVQRSYDARGEKPPFGLVTVGRQPAYFVHVDFHHLHPNSPFKSIGSYMRETLMYALEEEFAAKKRGEIPQEIASVYKRLDQLLKFRHDATPALELHTDLQALMGGGINTAAQIMSEVLEVVPRVYGSSRNPDKLTQVARNSESLINLLAAQHREFFFTAIVAFKEPPIPTASSLNPKLFQIEGEGDKQRLALSQAGNQLLEWKRQKILTGSVSKRHEPTVGCPALFNLGSGSAIRNLWNWYVEIAEKVYPHLVHGR